MGSSVTRFPETQLFRFNDRDHAQLRMRRQAVRILKLAHEEVDLPSPHIDEQPVMRGHPGRGPKYAASAIDCQAVREFGR